MCVSSFGRRSTLLKRTSDISVNSFGRRSTLLKRTFDMFVRILGRISTLLSVEKDVSHVCDQLGQEIETVEKDV